MRFLACPVLLLSQFMGVPRFHINPVTPTKKNLAKLWYIPEQIPFTGGYIMYVPGGQPFKEKHVSLNTMYFFEFFYCLTMGDKHKLSIPLPYMRIIYFFIDYNYV